MLQLFGACPSCFIVPIHTLPNLQRLALGIGFRYTHRCGFIATVVPDKARNGGSLVPTGWVTHAYSHDFPMTVRIKGFCVYL